MSLNRDCTVFAISSYAQKFRDPPYFRPAIFRPLPWPTQHRYLYVCSAELQQNCHFMNPPTQSACWPNDDKFDSKESLWSSSTYNLVSKWINSLNTYDENRITYHRNLCHLWNYVLVNLWITCFDLKYFFSQFHSIYNKFFKYYNGL